MPTTPPPRGSRLCAPVGWIEGEIDWYLANAVRISRGLPPLPPLPAPGPNDQVTIIREREVQRRTGISRVMRWKLEAKNRFPKRVKLTDFGAADAAD